MVNRGCQCLQSNFSDDFRYYAKIKVCLNLQKSISSVVQVKSLVDFLLQETVTNKNLLGKISAISRDVNSFPSLSVEFSALYVPASSSSLDRLPDGDADDFWRDRERTVSVVDLMIEKCHAKRREKAWNWKTKNKPFFNDTLSSSSTSILPSLVNVAALTLIILPRIKYCNCMPHLFIALILIVLISMISIHS